MKKALKKTLNKRTYSSEQSLESYSCSCVCNCSLCVCGHPSENIRAWANSDTSAGPFQRATQNNGHNGFRCSYG